MKTFDFPAWIRFGKLDGTDTFVTFELTDEEAERLIAVAHKGSYYGLDECEEVSDIHAKVYSAAVEQITRELRESDWCKEAQDESWRADELYDIGVNFPEELQDCEEDCDQDE